MAENELFDCDYLSITNIQHIHTKPLIMPKENKHSRGRRDEKKNKRKRDGEEGADVPSKRRKSFDNEVAPAGTDFIPLETQDDAPEIEARPFYGMLEDEEQEYFRRADQLLENNDFPSDEDRSLFLANVYREAEGKELKIACSQGCSRLMERLILLSTTEQKKALFEKFEGNFAHLVQHRFASHCCETLFVQSAGVVTQELTADTKKDVVEGEEIVTMESLFLKALDELEGKMTHLLTDRFASHALRVLLVVLSGRPLEQSATMSMLQSKKKEKIQISGHSSAPTEFALSQRAVPSSFEYAVEKIVSDTIATMDTSFIRILATHPTGNPTLQLLLELELSNPNTKKGINADHKTILTTLLPDDISKEDSESVVFLNGIMYEAIGSRLLETIMTHAPGRLFKQIYKTVFRDRIAALARNEISSYVVIKVLQRLSREDLEHASTEIISQIPNLIERRRTTVLKTLLERLQARGADTVALVEAIESAYGSETSTLILKMTAIDDIDNLTAAILRSSSHDPTDPSKPNLPPKPSPSQTHGSLLAQTMLSLPGPSTTLLQNSLLALAHPQLLTLALWTTTSHIIQTALLPTLPVPFRRKLINNLLSSDNAVFELALSPIGSHVLDTLLTSTTAPTPGSTSAPLFMLTEKIALVLCNSESQLRDSYSGRIVWRNWSVDLYKRQRGEWVRKVKEAGIAYMASLASLVQQSQPLQDDVQDEVEGEVTQTKSNKKKGKKGRSKGNDDDDGKPKKSAIQLAREKFAAKKNGSADVTHGKPGSGKYGKGISGANAVAVGVGKG